MHPRHKKILEILQGGKLNIKDAAERFGVTEMTLRRDLKVLEEKQQVLMVKSGAVLYRCSNDVQNNDPEHWENKLAIAQALYDRILPADTIFISTGSTSLAFASLIAMQNQIPMTVVTNSLSVASTLFRSCCKVFLLGGELRTDSQDLLGPITEKNLEEYHVNWLVTGCDSAMAESGFFTSDINLSNLEKKSISIADQVAVITDSSKFGHKSLTRFAEIGDIDLLVTDDGISQEDESMIAEAGVEIIKVPVENGGE